MRLILSVCLAASACIAFAACSLRAQAAPTFNLLYTFKTEGEAWGLVEVQPGRFFGDVSDSPGVFSITSAANYQYFYGFPTLQSGLGVFGLTPALNGQVYGSAAGLGVAPTFAELFSVAPNDKVTTDAFNPATGTPFDLMQSP